MSACVSAPLSGTQFQAVAALLAGRSPGDVARDCGVSPRTLRDWQQQPGFQAALLEGRARLLHEACLQLTVAASVAIHTLTQICQDSNQKGSVRVAAAGKLLNFLFRNAPQLAASQTATQTAAAAHAPVSTGPAAGTPGALAAAGRRVPGPTELLVTPIVPPSSASYLLPPPESAAIPAGRREAMGRPRGSRPSGRTAQLATADS